MRAEDWAAGELDRLREAALFRSASPWPETGGKIRVGGRDVLNFSCTDYLNLARHPHVVERAERALREAGCGATASRLMTGTLPLHEELEARLASLKRYPVALLFGSGYLASLGVIPALVGREDTVFADRLAHACLVDGTVLSRATLRRFEHNDAEHLRKLLKQSGARGRRLIVTESVFSMDGDLAPLPEIAGLASEFEAMLMVDEAHATGVFGPGGGGLVRQFDLEGAVTVSMGTLSKALGSYGGFAGGSKVLRELWVNRARSFIYSTALPPPVLGAALGALDVLEREPTLGSTLLRQAAGFRQDLEKAGLDTGNSESQIIPIMVGDNAKALSLSRRLKQEGVLAVAIRPPTVPEGSARLRLSVSLAHTPEDLKHAAEAIAAAVQAEGIIRPR